VRLTRKSELGGGNQSPFSALGRKTRELVAPSGCCPGSGNGSGRSERVGSSKRSRNDHYYFNISLSSTSPSVQHLPQFNISLSSTSPAAIASRILLDGRTLGSSPGLAQCLQVRI